MPTSSIELRLLEARDADRLTLCANNPKIAANVRDLFPSPYTREDATFWIEWNLERRDQDDVFNRVIALDDLLIGVIGVQRGADVHRFGAEIGYWLAEPYWGKGYATRAVQLMSDWVFAHTDIQRLYAGVFDYNRASQRVLEKAGYELEALRKRSVFKHGNFYDECIFFKLKK